MLSTIALLVVVIVGYRMMARGVLRRDSEDRWERERRAGNTALPTVLASLQIVRLGLEPGMMAWVEGMLQWAILDILAASTILLIGAIILAGPSAFIRAALTIAGIAAFFITIAFDHGGRLLLMILLPTVLIAALAAATHRRVLRGT